MGYGEEGAANGPIRSPKVARACDQCQFRKTKCDGNHPCATCLEMRFSCSFDVAPKKKRSRGGKRVDALRSAPTTQTMVVPLDDHLQQQQPTRADSLESGSQGETHSESIAAHPWPSDLDETEMFQLIDVFFERLHPTLPLLDRPTLFRDITRRRHYRERDFAALILALCAFTLIQPVQTVERISLARRLDRGREMLNAAARMRASGEYGENIGLEAVLTSFFMFGSLFGLGLDNAGWLRLREALCLACILGLDRPETYATLPPLECELRLRTFLILCVTERGYAIQRYRQVALRGVLVRNIQLVYELVRQAVLHNASEAFIHDSKGAVALLGLLQLVKLLDCIDDEVIECWSATCATFTGDKAEGCGRFDQGRISHIHDRIAVATRGTDDMQSLETALIERVSQIGNSSNVSLESSQHADIYVLQQWLHNRIWSICLSHGLLDDISPDPRLRIDYALQLAETTLQRCLRFKLGDLETHGLGMVRCPLITLIPETKN
ncbi:hypothetical protein PYCC9005_003044 [Savitreella phatthalungensis]